MKYVVGAVGSLPPGSRKIVTVGGRSIGVFNVDGRLYAIRNQCPHQGAPLCTGILLGELGSDGPGRYTFDGSRKLVKCPWHGWEFDLATGHSRFDPARERVRAYAVNVEKGMDVEQERGPYTVETVPVSVEDDYVVVEV